MSHFIHVTFGILFHYKDIIHAGSFCFPFVGGSPMAFTELSESHFTSLRIFTWSRSDNSQWACTHTRTLMPKKETNTARPL